MLQLLRKELQPGIDAREIRPGHDEQHGPLLTVASLPVVAMFSSHNPHLVWLQRPVQMRRDRTGPAIDLP